jgi:hypothetical protein
VIFCEGQLGKHHNAQHQQAFPLDLKAPSRSAKSLVHNVRIIAGHCLRNGAEKPRLTSCLQQVA